MSHFVEVAGAVLIAWLLSTPGFAEPAVDTGDVLDPLSTSANCRLVGESHRFPSGTAAVGYRYSSSLDGVTTVVREVRFGGTGNYRSPRAKSAISFADLSESSLPVGVRTVYTYDATGRLLKTVRDGAQTTKTFRYFNDACSVWVGGETRAWEADGLPEIELTYRYAASGDRVESVDLDTGGDGTIDGGIRYTYDSQGRRRTLERQGTAVVGGVSEHVAYSYRGFRLVTETIYKGNDDSIDEVVSYEYDGGGGPLIRVFRDLGADGTVDEMTRYVGSSSDGPMHEALDLRADGDFDQTISYTYDRYGHLLGKKRVRLTLTGPAVWESSYHYKCP